MTFSALLVGALLATTACQRQDEQVNKKLDYLIGKVEGLEKKMAAGPAVGARGAPAAGAPGAPMPPQRRGPDPAATYSVDVTGAIIEGSPNAKVTIVEAFEFACPFCQRVVPTIEQLKKDYGADIRVVKIQYIVHPDRATVPAWAACAAQIQGKYSELENKIWTEGFGKANLDEALMLKFAKDIGANVDKFKADMNGDFCKKKIADEQQRVAKVGVSGTPAFFINGRFLSGARPIEQFKALIDEELKKANDAIAKGGVTASDYYQKTVVEKGLKGLQ